MTKHYLSNVFCSALCFVATISQLSAASLEIPGTNIHVHVGEGPPITQTGPVFKSPGEILGNVAAGAICGPPCVAAFNKLDPKDRAAVTNAVTTGGFVVLMASDPIGGLTLGLLTNKDNAGGHNVNVPEHAASPTGKSWTTNVDCIVQRQNGEILAFSKNEYTHHGEMSRGDNVTLNAPVCGAYDHSLTSVTIKITGLSTDDAAQKGDMKYYLSGPKA